MDGKNRLKGLLLPLAILALSILPIWLIQVVPVADWPFHLAVSNEIFLLSQNSALNSYYYLNYSFMGYSLMHLSIAFLRNFFDIFTAGKIFLSMLAVLSIACWYAALKLLAPGKENLYILGVIANQSIFYYMGMFSFLLAVHIGILWIALAFSDKIKGWAKYASFTILGILTFMAHAYAFFLLAAPITAYLFYKAISKEDRSAALGALISIALCALFLFSTLTNPSMARDKTYVYKVDACSLALTSTAKTPDFKIGSVVPQIISASIIKAANFFPIGYFSSLFENPVYFLLLPLAIAYILITQAGKFNPKEFLSKIKPGKIKFNRLFALLALFFYLYFIIAPYHAGPIYFINDRSVPFLIAFALLAIEDKSLLSKITKVLFAIAIVSLLNESLAFYNAAGAQNKTIAAVRSMASQIPAGSKVFVAPGPWNSEALNLTSPIEGSPMYHALLLIYDPSIYLSNMYNFQDTFIMRSKMGIYDDLSDWDAGNETLTNLMFQKCYMPIPPIYDYYINPQMQLVKQ